MSKRDYVLLLQDMLLSAQKIKGYTDNSDFDSFLDDDKTKDAVIRNFEIIGEAANRMSETFRRAHQEIEWGRIRGFRNRIIHEYFGVDYGIVWDIIVEYLDGLIKCLKTLLDELI